MSRAGTRLKTVQRRTGSEQTRGKKKMARNFNGRRIQPRGNVAAMDWSQLDANELKAV